MKKTYTLITFLIFTLSGNAQNLEWVKSHGGGATDYGQSIAVDDSGYVYTTGYFMGVVDFDPGPGVQYLFSAGQRDIFVSKLDKHGNFIWAKAMGGPEDDISFSIALDSEGNIFTTGWMRATGDFDPGPGVYNLTTAGTYDVFISKLDPFGNFLWAGRIGGAGSEVSHALVLDGSGNVLITGSFNDSADFNPDPLNDYFLTPIGNLSNVYIVKLDGSGNFIWAKHFGGSAGGINSAIPRGIAVDGAGNVYTTGVFVDYGDFDPGTGVFNLTSAGSADIFISKLDASGDFIWANRMGGTGYDHGFSVEVDLMGNVYSTGYFQGTADFDPGVGDYNLNSSGGDDIYISKLNSSGNFVWAKKIGGTGTDTGFSLKVDLAGNLYITGWFSETADFDPGLATYNLTSSGGLDIFILMLDEFGNYVWAKSMGGANYDYGKNIFIDASNNIYTTGHFLETVDFDPGPGIYNLTSVGASDIFIHKMSTITGIEDFNAAGIIIYPNPVNGVLIINSEKEIGEIKIYDVVGKLIYQELIKNNNAEIDVKELDAGIYVLDTENRRMKFVKR